MFISNTSTLVLLAKVKCLEMFIEMSPKIEIPSQVRAEALFERDSYDSKLIQSLIQQNKINVVQADVNKVKEIMMQFRLDNGEAAAYVLFNKKRHKAVLTDDGELIKLCKLQKIPFICAMAIIIRLFEKNKLSKKDTLSKLEEIHNIGRYSKEIYEYFKLEVK